MADSSLDALRRHYESAIVAYEQAHTQYHKDSGQRDGLFRAGQYGEATAYIMSKWRILRDIQQQMNQAHAEYYGAVVSSHKVSSVGEHGECWACKTTAGRREHHNA